MSEQRPIIVVTGSSGLIGAGLVDKLAGAYHVVGLDIVPPSKPLPPHATFIQCDITDQQSIDNALDQVTEHHGSNIASVVHLAAYVDFSGEASDKYQQITLGGTRRLLSALVNIQPRQFIFSSTMLVHQPTEPGKPITEDDPLGPTWPYPQSKVDTENLIHEQRGQIPTAILRIAGVYDDRCNSIPLSHHIQRIYERHATARVFPGDPSHGQSFIHYDDLINAFGQTVDKRNDLPDELTLLIGEPQTLSYDEIQRTFSRLIHGEEWAVHRVPKPLAKTGAWVQDKIYSEEQTFIKPWMIDRADDHYELDISRARQMIDFQPRHNLKDTLAKMIGALKQDPLAWYEQHKLPLPGFLEKKQAG